jgi:hypothetical protein
MVCSKYQSIRGTSEGSASSMSTAPEDRSEPWRSMMRATTASKGVAGCYELGGGTPWLEDERLVETDPLVASQHRPARAGRRRAHLGGDVGDLVTLRFALDEPATEGAERPLEEGMHIVGLKPAGRGLFHLES